MSRLVAAHVRALALVAAWLAACSAGAAAAADADDGAAGEEIGEVLVTARRRAEAAQDVPIAISVLDAAALESAGAFNVGRLTQLEPTLQFFSTNPRNTAVNIRGLGAPFGLTNDGIEQGVGLYVDQVYQGRIAAATFDFLDVDRVEILRGPQGTLYGKNVTAGAINVSSRPPSFEPEAQAEISAGEFGFVQAKGSVSGALGSDSVAGRFAVSYTERDGLIRNVVTGRDLNSQDNLGVRGQVLWKATDDLELTFSGDYSHQNPECCVQIYARVGATQRPLNRQFAALAAAFRYAPPSTDAFDRLTDLDATLRAEQELGGASLLAEWQLGEGTLTSVTAWRFWNWLPSNDRDFTGLPITTRSNNPSKQDQYTQELRYAWANDDVDFVVGLFGFRQDLTTAGIQEQGRAASRWLLNPATAAANNPATLDGLRSLNDIRFANTSAAAFGQLDWRVTERFSIQPGLRINYDDKDADYVATVTNGTNTPLTAEQRSILAPQAYRATFDDWNVSYDLTLAYDLPGGALAFGKYARSFKTGGINLAGLPLDAANQPILAAATVDPETIDHFEVGLKSEFLGGRARANVAAYVTQVRDYQANVRNAQLAVLRGYLANADEVRVQGVELDFSIRPTERLNLYVNAAYTDGTYAKFVDAPCPPELSGGTVAAAGQAPSAPGTPGGISPANCDISGQWLPGISKWAASYGGEYGFPASVFGSRGEAYVGLDGNYRSTFSSNASRSIYTDVEGYAVHNLRLGYRSDAGWDVQAWLRNAFDEDYYELLATTPGDTGLVAGQPGDPRAYGVTLRMRF
ncbi:MAG: TonB-dependent receptor [Steroidobacteraceae bacterium]|jgi:iron complex outermembrane receptor protein|nr:TonB-dependent receptor [Steroidobacteraceae bacterium]